MIAFSWNKEVTFTYFSKKVQKNDGVTTYFRIIISKLTFFWMNSVRARRMMIDETGTKVVGIKYT